MSCLLVVFYYIPGNSAGNHFENSIDAFVQMKNSLIVLFAVLGNVLSIAFFNYFGIYYFLFIFIIFLYIFACNFFLNFSYFF